MQRRTPFGHSVDDKSRPVTRITSAIALVVLSLGLVACDNAMQSVAQQNSKNSPPIQVQLKPDAPSVSSGGELQFSATVMNFSNPSVVWSASAGAITGAGLFK